MPTLAEQLKSLSLTQQEEFNQSADETDFILYNVSSNDNSDAEVTVSELVSDVAELSNGGRNDLATAIAALPGGAKPGRPRPTS